LYACKIKETANGRWRGACGQTWQAIEVFAKRPIAENGELNESKRAAQDGEDEAQGEAHTKKQEEVEGHRHSVHRNGGEHFVTVNLSSSGKVLSVSCQSGKSCAITASGVRANSSEIPLA